MMIPIVTGTTAKRVRNVFRRLAVETRATEIAEAAAVLPLMFMMLLGIFWFGQAFSIYGAITRAAQEGARAGAAPYCTTCSGSNSPTTNASNAVNNVLNAAKLDPSLIRSSAPAVNACPSTATISGTCPPNAVCVRYPIQLSTTALGTSSVCGILVTLQYPFRFWLPFTSLNKQLIYLSATARVRLETQ
jgi:Flp pilus assembly protein TadG